MARLWRVYWCGRWCVMLSDAIYDWLKSGASTALVVWSLASATLLFGLVRYFLWAPLLTRQPIRKQQKLQHPTQINNTNQEAPIKRMIWCRKPPTTAIERSRCLCHAGHTCLDCAWYSNQNKSPSFDFMVLGNSFASWSYQFYSCSYGYTWKSL